MIQNDVDIKENKYVTIIIDLASLREQDMPYQCPYCFTNMNNSNIVGETEYNVFRLGHNIGGIALIFNCAKCFNKSFIHKNSLKWKIETSKIKKKET